MQRSSAKTGDPLRSIRPGSFVARAVWSLSGFPCKQRMADVIILSQRKVSGCTTDSRRLLDSDTERHITRATPGIPVTRAESCTAEKKQGNSHRPAEMRLRGIDQTRGTRPYSSS
jgi:hypothetical protein